MIVKMRMGEMGRDNVTTCERYNAYTSRDRDGESDRPAGKMEERREKRLFELRRRRVGDLAVPSEDRRGLDFPTRASPSPSASSSSEEGKVGM